MNKNFATQFCRCSLLFTLACSHGSRRLAWCSLFAGLVFLSAGCDTAHHISGTVTFEGKPVPGGRVVFVPDAAKGNSGGGASGQIAEGKFSTRLLQDGAYVITIYGHDGVPHEGAPGIDLFPPHEQEVMIGADATSLDFALPLEE